ncbi:MAG: DUF2851 family protein [Dehalococcoidales bacterium]|nr:MAG: DUF2851 family protein [Dehalococcoidales bacterium]
MVTSITDSNINEKQFREIWQRREITEQKLIAENGMTVRIVYPGRPNDGQGADFRDAVIITDRELRTGDVEFHLKSGDWRGHQHHLDPVYNRVILHVVKQHNARTGTVLQNGYEIPTVVIDDNSGVLSMGKGTLSKEQSSIGISCLNFTGYASNKLLEQKLDSAGKNRFFEKSERFYSEISSIGPGESLYRGIMEALGYSGNKGAFMELARRIPLGFLEMKKENKITDETYFVDLQCLLFGTAGFLTGENIERLCSAGLDRELVAQMMVSVQYMDMNDVMSPRSWRLFRIRPCNSPFRRLAAMSYLLLKYRRKGLLESMLDLIDSVSDSAKPRELEKELVVSAGRTSYLGKNRAAEIIVNVLLPFTFAYGEYNNEPELSEKALALYTNYPGLEMNSLLRHMIRQLGFEKSAVKTAIRQQGMIHIYKNLCTQGRCHDCELSKFKAGCDIQGQPVYLPGFESEKAAGGDHRSIIGA